MPIPTTLTVRQVRQATGFSRASIYGLVKRGEWQAIKVGDAPNARLRILESSIVRWFEQQSQGSTAPPRALDADHALPTVPNPFA